MLRNVFLRLMHSDEGRTLEASLQGAELYCHLNTVMKFVKNKKRKKEGTGGAKQRELGGICQNHELKPGLKSQDSKPGQTV